MVSGIETLRVLHAGALRNPMKRLAREFQTLFPEIEVHLESAGSRACARQILDGKRVDIVALADPVIFTELLVPHPVKKYYIFATDQIVITYDMLSRGHDRISGLNWFEILLREDVSFARSNENLDPCGYRTLMVWQLAEKHYRLPGLYQQLNAKCSARYIYPKSVDLYSALLEGQVDYAFQYRCVAQQFNLHYVTLPEQINLSNPIFTSFYNQATVEVEGRTTGSKTVLTGQPIEFAIAVLENSSRPELANQFLQYTLSPAGRKILDECGLIAY